MVVMVPAFKILGIAFASSTLNRQLEERGHGGKVVFVNVLAHIACGYIVIDLLRDALSHFVHVLGILG